MRWSEPPRATKFQLLLAKDIACVALPVVVFSFSQRLGYFLAVLLACFIRYSRRRAAKLSETLEPRQMRFHAAVVVAGYVIWIAGIIYGDIVYNTPAMWALSSVFIPVLCVLCYSAVRVNLGLDQPMSSWTQTSNHAIQRTAGRSDV